MAYRAAVFVPAVEILDSVVLSIPLILAVLSPLAINFTQPLPIVWQSTGQVALVGTITVITKLRTDRVRTLRTTIFQANLIMLSVRYAF